MIEEKLGGFSKASNLRRLARRASDSRVESGEASDTHLKI